VYLKPEDVDIKDPPITVNNIRNKDKSKLDGEVVIPDVAIDDTIPRNVLKKFSFGTTKKYKKKVIIIIKNSK
tara:strand:+ start:320 stop:535 length:216 start_codon:yes stop_codon:yes gene_type:complete